MSTRCGSFLTYSLQLFRFEDRKGGKYLLSPTHEEEITSLVGSIVKSYKELPLRLYQICALVHERLSFGTHEIQLANIEMSRAPVRVFFGLENS